MSAEHSAARDARCGSCGQPAEFTITLRGRPIPACLRHLNHWRTPASDYTCPTACVEQNHPGREHAAWLADFDVRVAPPAEGAPAEHGYGVESDCACGRNFVTVRGLREHLTKARLRVTPNGGAA